MGEERNKNKGRVRRGGVQYYHNTSVVVVLHTNLRHGGIYALLHSVLYTYLPLPLLQQPPLLLLINYIPGREGKKRREGRWVVRQRWAPIGGSSKLEGTKGNNNQNLPIHWVWYSGKVPLHKPRRQNTPPVLPSFLHFFLSSFRAFIPFPRRPYSIHSRPIHQLQHSLPLLPFPFHTHGQSTIVYSTLLPFLVLPSLNIVIALRSSEAYITLDKCRKRSTITTRQGSYRNIANSTSATPSTNITTTT